MPMAFAYSREVPVVVQVLRSAEVVVTLVLKYRRAGMPVARYEVQSRTMVPVPRM